MKHIKHLKVRIKPKAELKSPVYTKPYTLPKGTHITKTTAQARIEKDKFDSYNIFRKMCPECGETRNFLDAVADGRIDYGIIGGITRSGFSGLFGTYKELECFNCLTCGASWEIEKI